LRLLHFLQLKYTFVESGEQVEHDVLVHDVKNELVLLLACQHNNLGVRLGVVVLIFGLLVAGEEGGTDFAIANVEVEVGEVAHGSDVSQGVQHFEPVEGDCVSEEPHLVEVLVYFQCFKCPKFSTVVFERDFGEFCKNFVVFD